MKRWTAVINHSRASGKPPKTAEFDLYDALQAYLAPDSEVVAIAIYRGAHPEAALISPSPPLPLRPWGRRGPGEVGDSRAAAAAHLTFPSLRDGPLRLPQKGGEGLFRRRRR